MLSDALHSKAASPPHSSGFLVLLLGSPPPRMPNGKIRNNTPKSALAKLNTKAWCTSWSFLPLYVSISIPDSLPQHSSGTDSKTKAGRGLATKEKLLTPLSSRASLADRTEGFGVSLLSLLLDSQPCWLWLPGDLFSPTPQSPHLGCWTYSPPQFPPGTNNISFSYYFLCQLGGIKTPNTYTDLFSPEGIWSSLLSLEGTNISHYKVPD